MLLVTPITKSKRRWRGAVVGSLLVAVLMSLVKLKTWQSGLLLTMLLAHCLVLDFSPRGWRSDHFLRHALAVF
jgi:hypothetical protein